MSPRWLTVLFLSALSASSAFAQEAKNPLRFLPSQVEWVVKIDRPRELFNAVEKVAVIFLTQVPRNSGLAVRRKLKTGAAGTPTL